jgi:anaerobic magnesium-protoporphyrin IX monomethyl ester cyclase
VVFCFYTNDHEINLGIGFMSAALKRSGIDTELVIYRDVPGKEIDTPESVVARIVAKNPTVVAFSAMTFHWQRIKEVITLLRKIYEGVILVGGYKAILSPEEVLEHPGVDGICVGEGELPLIRAVTAYDKGSPAPEIAGMVFRDQQDRPTAFQSPWLVEKLDDYPFLDYEIFESEGAGGLRRMHLGAMAPGGIFSLPVIVGRGCPYKCTYCCNSALVDRYGGMKAYLRKYSIESAIVNVKGMSEKYRPELIEFFDETFIRNKVWVKEFCAIYRQEIGVPFMIMARIDTLDDELVSSLAESGLKLVLFGLESGDEEYRMRYLNRKMRDTTIKDGSRLLKKYGIMMATFNMFGMPFETRNTVEKTFALNAEIEPDAAFSFIYQPLPGTELARLSRENDFSAKTDADRWDLRSPSLDTAELPASYVAEKVQEFQERFAGSKIVGDFYEKLKRSIDQAHP